MNARILRIPGVIAMATALLIMFAPSARASASKANVAAHRNARFELPNRQRFSSADRMRFQKQSDQGRDSPCGRARRPTRARRTHIRWSARARSSTTTATHGPSSTFPSSRLSCTSPTARHRTATKPTGCGESTTLSPRDLVAESPIFQDHNYTIGGTFVGRGQYADKFQRANFWQAIQHAHNNPYEVRLQPSFITVKLGRNRPLPSIRSPLRHRVVTAGSSTVRLGQLYPTNAHPEPSHLSELIPDLPRQQHHRLRGRAPGFFDVAGNHGSFTNSDGLVQTYAEVDYDTTQSFFALPDVEALAHEVGEWMDDPLNSNTQPCYDGGLAALPAPPNGLEVGDPLVGITVPVGPMPNGVTYHPQELVFASWFYDQIPSQAVNPTWYSSNGTFTQSRALVCTYLVPTATTRLCFARMHEVRRSAASRCGRASLVTASPGVRRAARASRRRRDGFQLGAVTSASRAASGTGTDTSGLLTEIDD